MRSKVKNIFYMKIFLATFLNELGSKYLNNLW